MLINSDTCFLKFQSSSGEYCRFRLSLFVDNTCSQSFTQYVLGKLFYLYREGRPTYTVDFIGLYDDIAYHTVTLGHLDAVE